MLSKEKKHKMKVAGLISLVLGFFLFLVFWALTKNWNTLIIVPVAVLMGAGQAYLMPDPDD